MTDGSTLVKIAELHSPSVGARAVLQIGVKDSEDEHEVVPVLLINISIIIHQLLSPLLLDLCEANSPRRELHEQASDDRGTQPRQSPKHSATAEQREQDVLGVPIFFLLSFNNLL